MASFGFSIGDFLAVGDLARKIADALSESRGATAEYKSLCELLLSLNRALYAASAAFFYPASNTILCPDKASLNGIRFEMECCKRLMAEFLESSKKYTESLLNGRHGRRFQDEWRKVTWRLYRVDDVRKLQASLQGHVDAFQLYTSAIMWQGLAHTAINGAETNRRFELKMTEAFVLLKNIQKNLPKAIGYTWEGGWTKDQRPIHLEDALGRDVMLPLVLCRSKDTFHDVLKIMFKGLPGYKNIAQKEYEVVEDSEGTLIQDSDWGSKVFPGVRIAMSILIRAQPTSKFVTAAHKCPRCNTPNPSATLEKGSIKCCFCQLIFRTHDFERIVKLPGPMRGARYSSESLVEPENLISGEHPEKSTDSPVSQIIQPKKPRNQRTPREEDAFRRIHYHQEVLIYRMQPFFNATPEEFQRILSISNPFLSAVFSGDQSLVQNLLDEGANPDTVEDGYTALYLTSIRGNVGIFKLLVGAGVNVQPVESRKTRVKGPLKGV